MNADARRCARVIEPFRVRPDAFMSGDLFPDRLCGIENPDLVKVLVDLDGDLRLVQCTTHRLQEPPEIGHPRGKGISVDKRG
jgi:hypothetical protein